MGSKSKVKRACGPDQDTKAKKGKDLHQTGEFNQFKSERVARRRAGGCCTRGRERARCAQKRTGPFPSSSRLVRGENLNLHGGLKIAAEAGQGPDRRTTGERRDETGGADTLVYQNQGASAVCGLWRT